MHIGLVVWALFDARGGIERFGTNLAAEMIRRGKHRKRKPFWEWGVLTIITNSFPS